jgi:hypothetical protein
MMMMAAEQVAAEENIETVRMEAVRGLDDFVTESPQSATKRLPEFIERLDPRVVRRNDVRDVEAHADAPSHSPASAPPAACETACSFSHQ